MKPIDDRGHSIVALKPFGLKRYEPSRTPDPGQCVDCLIIINDRRDGVPRGRLSVSNGASWDHVAWLDEIKTAAAPLVQAPPIDLIPLVRNAVAEMLPTIPVREIKTIAAAPSNADTQAIATALLEMSETINRLARENNDLQQRVAFLEDNALARAQLIREAS